MIETLSMRCLCRIEGGVEVPADLLLVLPLQMSGRKLVYSQVPFSLDKKSNGKLKCACGMGVGLVTHKFPICGLLSTRVPPVDGWRRLRRQLDPEGGGNHIVQLICKSCREMIGISHCRVIVVREICLLWQNCQCCPPDDVSNALL